jgi:hypothetical protein
MVKEFLMVMAGAALFWALVLPVQAQQGQPPGPRFARPGPAPVPARPAPPQQIPARDAGPHNAIPQRDPHMSPEERRQLRRDVHDHGRDIYRDRGGPRR